MQQAEGNGQLPYKPPVSPLTTLAGRLILQPGERSSTVVDSNTLDTESGSGPNPPIMETRSSKEIDG